MKRKELILLLILAIIASPVFFWWSSQYSSPTSELPVTVNNYEPVNLTPNFSVLWAKSNAYAYYEKGAVMLAAAGQNVIFLGSLTQDESASLISFKAETGEIEWVKLNGNQSANGTKLAVLANDQLVYVVFDAIWRVPGDATFGAVKIRAYQAESGHLVWTQIVKGAKSINSLMVTNTTISVDGNSSANYYLLDAQSGQIIETRYKKDTNYLWFSRDGILYERVQLHSFQAINQRNGDVVWQSPFWAVYQSPILSSGILLVRSGTSASEGTIYALDSVTGDVLWEYAGVVSNVAVQDSTAYFLTSNAQLLAVNIREGNIVGSVDFGTDKFVLQDENLFSHGFSVVAINNTVSVHLGDSQQLFAFHFLSDE
jgi:outer membrane protein assembly factor BamB